MTLKNKKVIVLGIFSAYPELSVLFELITRAGGHIRKSLSNKIDYIILGDYNGEKMLNDAKNYQNITIISEQEIAKLLQKT